MGKEDLAAQARKETEKRRQSEGEGTSSALRAHEMEENKARSEKNRA